jgi:hypothetical protein
MSKTEYKIPCQKSQGRPTARGKDLNVKQLSSERRILTMTKELQNNGRSCDLAVLVQTNMPGCEDVTRRNCNKLRDLSGLVFRLEFSWIAKIASDRSRDYTSPHPCDDAAPKLSRAVRSIERVAKSFRPATSANHLPAQTVDSSVPISSGPNRDVCLGKQRGEQKPSSARQPWNRLQRRSWHRCDTC